jgi:aryl carrier-like protein
LDSGGNEVPIGVTGELYIGGEGVARGYLNRPELSGQKFVTDRFSKQAGAKMYRTGDLGRWLSDGNIEFLGRNDFQVKIRGFRIELGEIESRLMEHEQVREAVVVAREDGAGDKRLVAYVTLESDVGAEELRGHLSRQMPEYMIPAAIVKMERLPLTPNGKLDRKGLPKPEMGAYATREYEEPQGETEIRLAEIWSELLKVERVGRHDNFFELGGHSLLVVALVERMRSEGMTVEIRSLFGSPTIQNLAIISSSAGATIEVPKNLVPDLSDHLGTPIKKKVSI